MNRDIIQMAESSLSQFLVRSHVKLIHGKKSSKITLTSKNHKTEKNKYQANIINYVNDNTNISIQQN